MPSDAINSATAAYRLDWSDPAEMKDEQLVGFINKNFENGKQRRRVRERQAALIEAWAEGDQDRRLSPQKLRDDIVSDYESWALGEEVPFKDRFPVHVNMMRVLLFQKIALLLGQPTTLIAPPTNTGADDVQSARVQTKLLRYLWLSGSEPVRRNLVITLWKMFCTGLEFIHPRWDPFVGAMQRTGPEIPEKATAKERKRLTKAWQEKLAAELNRDPEHMPFDEDGINLESGDVAWEWPRAADITEPQGARSIAGCTWLIHTTWMDMEELEAKYGAEKVAEVNPQNALADWSKDHADTYGRAQGGDDANSVPPEHVQVHKLWRPVRPWSPVGALVVVADNRVLFKGPHPYGHGELPFIPLIEQPSRYFWPRSTGWQLHLLQARRNDLLSMAQGHVEQVTAPHLIVEADADLPEDFMDRKAKTSTVPVGAIAEKKFMFREVPTMSTDVYRLQELYRDAMEQVANVHSSSRGQGTSAQQSGRHAAILLKRDEAGGFVARELIETSLADAGRQSLFLFHQYVSNDRTVAITGQGMMPEVFTFKGESLLSRTGNKEDPPGPHDFNVLVRLGVLEEADEMTGRIQAYVEMGFWNMEKPDDRAAVARLLGDRVVDEQDAFTINTRNAALENAELMAGEEIKVAIGDGHELHVAEHMKFTTTGPYREKLKKDGKLAEAMERHILTHYYQNAQNRAMLAIADKETEHLEIEDLKRRTGAAPQGQGAGPPTAGPPGPSAPRAIIPMSRPAPTPAAVAQGAMR